MRLHVLGSAAGGGFPQWNCNCPNCAAVRRGEFADGPRSQSSITVSGDGENWLLVDASPDLSQQIRAFAPLQPARAVRDTGIKAVLLTDAQIDHSTGLYLLREHPGPLEVWCSRAVRDDLSRGNPIFPLLQHFCGIRWQPLPLDEEFAIAGIPGLRFVALPLQSMAPPYSPHRHDPHPGDTIGLSIIDAASGRRAFYAPGLGAIDGAVFDAMAAAHCLLVDGTFWTDDEMIRLGVSAKRAAELGHLPQSGPGGLLEWLGRLPATTRKLLIHINNTNPILDAGSAERARLARLGVEVAADGLEIAL